MRTPEFLKKNAVIGLCAPSFGCTTFPYKERLTKAIEIFSKQGYKIICTNSCFSYYKCASASKQIRASEFLELWNNDEVDFIFSVGGGEMMMEILEYIDFNELKNSKKIKYFMGYSDNTNLTFLLTTLADIKSIYGECFPTFARNFDESLNDALSVIKGEKKILKNYNYYNLDKEELNPFASFNLVLKSEVKSINYNNERITGRIIGGCLDILTMICGTVYDKVEKFCETYKNDGIIWYFEACDLNVLAQKRAYWQIKNANWLKNVKAIMIGRPVKNETMLDIEYLDVLKELPNVAIIYDLDIGHVPPSFTIINGSLVEIEMKNENFYIKYLEEKE